MTRTPYLLCAVALGASALSGCDRPALPPVPRVSVNSAGGNTFELVPEIPDGSPLRHCLAFTRSAQGVVRQLTMTHENKSVPCESGAPVAGVRFRAPVEEGPVKVHVFFSDQKLNAGSIAQQLYDRKGDPSFQPMDLRLPGSVVVATGDFNPLADDTPPTVGGQVDEGGGLKELPPPKP